MRMRRRPCRHGGRCYRQNPDHKSQFSHPGDFDWEVNLADEDDDDGGLGCAALLAAAATAAPGAAASHACAATDPVLSPRKRAACDDEELARKLQKAEDEAASQRMLQHMLAPQQPQLVGAVAAGFTDSRALYMNSLAGCQYPAGSPSSLPRSPRTISFGDICAGEFESALMTCFNRNYDRNFIARSLPRGCRTTVVEGEELPAFPAGHCQRHYTHLGGGASSHMRVLRAKARAARPAATATATTTSTDPTAAAAGATAAGSGGSRGGRGQHILMHAKLHLLRHREFLRVAISSANQSESEWRDAVQISWVCDFPKRRRQPPQPAAHTDSSSSSGTNRAATAARTASPMPHQQSGGGGAGTPSDFAERLALFVGCVLSEYPAERTEWQRVLLSEYALDETVIAAGVHLVATVPGSFVEQGIVETKCPACREWVPKAGLVSAASLEGNAEIWCCPGQCVAQFGGCATDEEEEAADELWHSSKVLSAAVEPAQQLAQWGIARVASVLRGEAASGRGSGGGTTNTGHPTPPATAAAAAAVAAVQNLSPASTSLPLHAATQQETILLARHHGLHPDLGFTASDPIFFQCSSLSSMNWGVKYGLQHALTATAADGSGSADRAELLFVFPSQRYVDSGGANRGLGFMVFKRDNWWLTKPDTPASSTAAVSGYGNLRGCPPGCQKKHGSWAANGRHFLPSLIELNPVAAGRAGRRPYGNHSKCIVRRCAATGGGWIYAGSANASGGAWGSLHETEKAKGSTEVRCAACAAKWADAVGKSLAESGPWLPRGDCCHDKARHVPLISEHQPTAADIKAILEVEAPALKRTGSKAVLQERLEEYRGGPGTLQWERHVGGRKMTTEFYELGVLLTDVHAIDDYDLPFSLEGRRFDAVRDEPPRQTMWSS